MKLSHAMAVLAHARTLEPLGTLSGAIVQQLGIHVRSVNDLKAARKALTASARRARELARLAEAVYPDGTFKAVIVKPTKTAPVRKLAQPAKVASTIGKQMSATVAV